MRNVVSAFYDGRSELDLHSVNQILQTLVCLADSVWLNVDWDLSMELPQHVSKHVRQLIGDLQDNGSIRLWGYPFQQEKGQEIRKIDYESYREIADRINETFMTDLDLLPKVSLTYVPRIRKQKGIETTSKIISIRKEYWSLAISDLLGADRLIIDSSYHNMWLACLPKIEYSRIRQEVTSHVLRDLFRVPDLTSLKCEDILYLQRISRPLRDKVDRICSKILIEFQYDDDVLKEANQLTEEVLDFVDEKSRDSGSASILKDISYTIAGIFLPHIAALPLAEKFLNWLSTRRRYGYVMFAAKLRRILRKRRQENEL